MITSQGEYQAWSRQRQRTVSQPPNICMTERPVTHRVSTFLIQILLKMYFHSWICTYVFYCAVTMAAGFGINRFQLSIKYISWMVGIVPLVSQTATAGGEAGVGGLCGCAWQRKREMWYSRAAVMWSAGNPARFYPSVRDERKPEKLSRLSQRGREVSKYNNGKQ